MFSKNPKSKEFTVNSSLQCPDCEVDVHVGTGGGKNLELHRNSKTCKESQQVAARPAPKKDKSLLTFFSRNAQRLNAPRVASPPLVHADPIPVPEACEEQDSPSSAQSSSTQSAPHPVSPLPVHVKPSQSPKRQEGCLHALESLKRLEEAMSLIPQDVKIAGPGHPLAGFSGSPDDIAQSSMPDDDWEEILNPKMKNAFGWDHMGIQNGFA